MHRSTVDAVRPVLGAATGGDGSPGSSPALTIAAGTVLLVQHLGKSAPDQATAHGATSTGPKVIHTATTKASSSKRGVGGAASPAGNQITISAVGDTMLGNTPTLPPDPLTYLQPVEAALRAQLSSGTLRER